MSNVPMDFEEEVRQALEEAKIPADVVGKKFRFGSSRFEQMGGFHHNILLGIVTGLEISDEGLEVYVSTPLFWGMHVVCLTPCGKGWVLVAETHNATEKKLKYEKTSFEGEFTLL